MQLLKNKKLEQYIIFRKEKHYLKLPFISQNINFAKLEKFEYIKKQPQGFTPCGFLCVQKVRALKAGTLQALLH